jgi:hypothetical protein
MDFPIPAKTINLLGSLAKLTKDLPSLKIGQQIEVKVLDVSLEKNIIKLQLGKTTLEAQPQPSLATQQNTPHSQSSLTAGQTLKLLVTKLIPAPELKIEKSSIPTELIDRNKTNPLKNQQANLPPGPIKEKSITLKLLNNPIAATKAFNTQLSDLKMGQKIPARAITITNQKIQFQLFPEQKTTRASQHQSSKPGAIISIDLQKNDPQKKPINETNTAKPQIKIGQTVVLEIIKTGIKPQFKIVENERLPFTISEKLITETIKKNLPIQQAPDVFINQLIRELPELSKSTTLPETLKRLAQQILQNLPAKKNLAQPQEIKRSINNSGLFLESKLAQSEKNPQLSVQDDFKANLIKFLQSLKQLPTPTPQSETNSLTPEAKNLKQLQNQGDSSIAKLVLDQLNTLPKEDTPKQIWHLEIPYINQKNAQTLSLQIEKDKQNQAEGEKENWSVSITLTPPSLGKLHCKVSSCNQTINTHFWSDSPKTTNLISHNLEYLKSQLEASGLKTGLMESHQDMPTLKLPQNLSNTNLVDEQI